MNFVTTWYFIFMYISNALFVYHLFLTQNPTLPILSTISSSIPEHDELLSSDDDNTPLLINADIHYYDNDDGVFYP